MRHWHPLGLAAVLCMTPWSARSAFAQTGYEVPRSGRPSYSQKPAFNEPSDARQDSGYTQESGYPQESGFSREAAYGRESAVPRESADARAANLPQDSGFPREGANAREEAYLQPATGSQAPLMPGAGQAVPMLAPVPADLAAEPAYTEYARHLVAMDLMAHPATASLPVKVYVPRPGTLLLRGSVPSQALRDYLYQSARRVSGLEVVAELRVEPLPQNFTLPVTPADLEARTTESIAAFFPHLAETVRATVDERGIIFLNGEAANYEEGFLLCQLLLSQAGCKAVVNFLTVLATPDSGMVMVSNDGRLMLPAHRLPSIPAAPLVDLDQMTRETPTPHLLVAHTETKEPTVRGLPAESPAKRSDDQKTVERRLIDDVRAALNREPLLVDQQIEIDVQRTTAILTGELGKRENVIAAVEAVATVPEITKIVARTHPISIQVNRPEGLEEPADAASEAEPKGMMKLLAPLGVGRKPAVPDSPATSWRFRENVRRDLKKACEKRVDSLSVRNTIKGLEIVGEVPSGRDRTFVLRQIDQLPTLSSVPYTVTLTVKEF